MPLFRCERYDQPHLGDRNFDDYSYERWTWQELGSLPLRSLCFLRCNASPCVAGGGHEPKDGALRGKAAIEYLKLAASIVIRELDEESYNSVEGFAHVRAFLSAFCARSPCCSSFKLRLPLLLPARALVLQCCTQLRKRRRRQLCGSCTGPTLIS